MSHSFTRALARRCATLTRAAPSRPVAAQHTAARWFSCSSACAEVKKPDIKSIAALRQAVPGTSMLKAREALLTTRSPTSPDTDDVAAAVRWLEEDRLKSGAAKSEKVLGRTAADGLIGICILADGLPAAQAAHEGVTSPRAAIIELNCETDFVGRNDVFLQLLRDIAHSTALYPVLSGSNTLPQPTSSSSPSLVELPVEQLLQFPILSSSSDAPSTGTGSVKTISSAIIDAVARLGEKITLSRAAALFPAQPSTTSTPEGSSSQTLHVVSAYAHGGPSVLAPQTSSASKNAPGSQLSGGRVASLLLTRISSTELSRLAAHPEAETLNSARALMRSLARQAAGMQTDSIVPGPDEATAPPSQGEPSRALYAQPFAMLLPAAAPSPDSASQPVTDVLRAWSVAHGLGSNAVHVEQMQRWELGALVAP